MPRVQLSDIRCYYELDGSGPPLLMIPGLGGTVRDWDAVVPALAKCFTCIRVDNRGAGESQAIRPARTLHHYSADLLEFLDHLQIDSAHVLGLSLGGIIAQRFAMDHPDRVNRMVLVSCAHRFVPYLREMTRMIGQTVLRFGPGAFQRAMALFGYGPKFLDAHPEHLLGTASAGAPLVSRRAVVQQLRALAASDPKPGEHHRIVAPALVVAGEYDTIVPHCYQKEMAELIGNSEFHLLKDTGHNPFIECPEIATGLVNRFLGCPPCRYTHPESCAA